MPITYLHPHTEAYHRRSNKSTDRIFGSRKNLSWISFGDPNQKN